MHEAYLEASCSSSTKLGHKESHQGRKTTTADVIRSVFNHPLIGRRLLRPILEGNECIDSLRHTGERGVDGSKILLTIISEKSYVNIVSYGQHPEQIP